MEGFKYDPLTIIEGEPPPSPGRGLTFGNFAKSGLMRRMECLQGYLAHNTPPPPLGPYSRTVPRALWRFQGVGVFL